MLKKGYLTKNEQNFTYYLIGIDALVTVVITLILAFLNIELYLKIAIPIAVLLFIYVIGTNFVPKNRNLKKLIKKFHKNMDFNEFDDKYEIYINNDLDPDTLTYLKLMRTNILYSINKEKAISDFLKIEKPKSKIISVYYFVELLNLINSNKLDEADSLLKKSKSSGLISKSDISNMELLIKVYRGKENINNIEEIYKTNTKAKYYNMVNMHILMIYYDRRDNAKAKEYANMIISANTQLLQYNNDALEILK